MVGVKVFVDIKVLVGEGLGKVFYDDEFVYEKLFLIFGLFCVDNFEDVVV